MTDISEGAFFGCANLATVIIPDSVTSIGNYAFCDCTSLTSMYFESNAPEIGRYMFQNTGSVTIHDRAGTTGWGPTFDNRPTALWIPIMPNLPSVTTDNPLRLVTHSPAPATVRIQRSVALEIWDDWQTVSRDEGPSMLIDSHTFPEPNRCPEGKSGDYSIPDGVADIGDYAFWDCDRLIRITVPESVGWLGDDAFGGTDRLIGVYFEGDPPGFYYQELYPTPLDGSAHVVVVYYRPGTASWDSHYCWRPTALWIPVVPNLTSVTTDKPLRLVTHSPAPATVRIQRSVDLEIWDDWQTVSRDEGPSMLTDSDAFPEPYRFYRGVEE